MSDKENDGWHDFPAPDFELVLVSGWTRQADGYWWVREDMIGGEGYPINYPDARLWQPFPLPPNRPMPPRKEDHP